MMNDFLFLLLLLSSLPIQFRPSATSSSMLLSGWILHRSSFFLIAQNNRPMKRIFVDKPIYLFILMYYRTELSWVGTSSFYWLKVVEERILRILIDFFLDQVYVHRISKLVDSTQDSSIIDNANLSTQTKSSWKKRWSSQWYYSIKFRYNNIIG